MKRHQLFSLLLASAGVALTALPQIAAAQTDRPAMKILVGFPPGGSVDTVARLMAEHMRAKLGGQNIVVENKPGAAGRIAIAELKKAAPDGNTVIIMPSGPVVLFPHVFKSLAYDPVKDFTPISQLVNFQFCIVSGPATGAKNIAEMISKAKANPDGATYGSSGNGTVPHFLGLMLNDSAGINLRHIAYQGGAPAMTALLGGHIGYNVDVVTEALEQHRSGKVRIIAVAGATRSPQVPEVPTLREQGVAMDATAWFAMYGPAGLSRETTTRLSEAVASAMKEPVVRERMNALALEIVASTPEQLAGVQRADFLKWEKPVKASGFQAD